MQAQHTSSDDWFIARQLKKCRQQRLLVEKDKASRLAAEKVEGEALAILESDDDKKKLKIVELQKLFLFYGVERKDQAKTAAAMRDQYKSLKEKNASPKAYKKWSGVDEANLDSLKNENISIDETELGKQRARLRKKKERDLALFAKEVDDPEALIGIIQEAVSSPSSSSSSTVSVVAPWQV